MCIHVYIQVEADGDESSMIEFIRSAGLRITKKVWLILSGKVKANANAEMACVVLLLLYASLGLYMYIIYQSSYCRHTHCPDLLGHNMHKSL